MNIEVTWQHLAIFGLVFAAGFGIAAIGLPGGDAPQTAEVADPTGTATSTSHPTAASATATPVASETPQDTSTPVTTEQTVTTPEQTPNTERYDMNTTAVEVAIHDRINEIRQEKSLPLLDYDSELAAIAAYHSEDMATRLYFAHESPDNETMQDRYDQFGYDCEVPKHDGTGEYATGAENIDKTFYKRQVVRDDGSMEYYDTVDKLATGIVKDWMNEQSQRRLIMQKYWQNEGIGVTAYENDEGEIVVLATQNFC